MNLDPNATYELVKVGTKNVNSIAVKEGDKVSGPALMYGKSLVVGNLITSSVEKTTEQDNGTFIVETRNSVYTLEKVK